MMLRRDIIYDALTEKVKVFTFCKGVRRYAYEIRIDDKGKEGRTLFISEHDNNDKRYTNRWKARRDGMKLVSRIRAGDILWKVLNREASERSHGD